MNKTKGSSTQHILKTHLIELLVYRNINLQTLLLFESYWTELSTPYGSLQRIDTELES